MNKKHSVYLMDLKQLTIALLCMPLFSVTAHADEDIRIWSRIGPEGADINQVVISPSQPNTLYAATSPSSYYATSNEFILKSLNGGDSWVTLPWQGSALRTETLVANRIHQTYSAFFSKPPWQGRTLAVDSGNPEIVFTSLSGFLLKTSNSGMSWRSIGADINLDSTSFFLLNNSINSSLSALVSPDNDLAHTDDSEHWVLSKSSINTDIQQTIEPSSRYPKGESSVQLLSTDPKNSAILYGYTTLRHRSAFLPVPVALYKSSDKGGNWLDITPSGYRYIGGDVVVDTDNSQLLFAIFAKTKEDSFVDTVDEHLIMRSDDGGISWQALSVPTSDTTKYDVTHVYLDPLDKNTLYANISPNNDASQGETKAIAKSVDLGKSWEIINIAPYFPGSIVINPENNTKLFMASKQGILRSDNGGKNWSLSNRGIQHIGGKLSVAMDDSLVMYLAKNDPGAFVNSSAKEIYYKSSDGGQHWQSFVTNQVVTEVCQEFKINPKNNQDIFCVSDENIYQSLDGGEQWVHLKKSATQQLIRAQDGLSIYLSDSTGTSISDDNGQSWKLISTINEGELSLHPQNQATLYYILDNQLYASEDSGEHWFSMETPNNIAFKHLLIHPLNPDFMVLYDFYSYLLTVDGGNNWRIVLETFNNGNTKINSFPAEFNFISQLVLHPTDINSVFVKTNTGIYQSSGQGTHWEKRSSGLESYSLNSYIGTHLLTSANDVYADTASGIFKLTDKVNFTAVSDCIFSWVEQENTDLFAPAAVNSQQWNGYNFRYYSQTNTYLGIFHEQEIHQLQADVSSDIIPQDSIASYQNLSGCTDKRFKLTDASATPSK